MFFISCQNLCWFFRYLNSCTDFLGIQKNESIRKLRLISKFLTSQNEQQVITIHRLSNISRSKGNQAMKFGQLIEHSMKNIFLGKSYTKFDGEASPRPFYKKSKLNIRSTVRNVISLLLLYVLVEIYENILKRSW